MLALLKKAGLIFCALVAALLIYLMASAPPHEEELETGHLAPPVVHFSHHSSGATPGHAPADRSLVLTIAQTAAGVQLSLGSAGQSSVSTLPEIQSVLGNYAAEGSSVDLYLTVDSGAPFSSVQEVIEASMKFPHVHMHLLDKYLLTNPKQEPH